MCVVDVLAAGSLLLLTLKTGLFLGGFVLQSIQAQIKQ